MYANAHLDQGPLKLEWHEFDKPGTTADGVLGVGSEGIWSRVDLGLTWAEMTELRDFLTYTLDSKWSSQVAASAAAAPPEDSQRV